MRTAMVSAIAATMIAVLLAACGSSSQSSSPAASSPVASSAAPTASTGTPPSTTGAVLITTKRTKLGTILGAGQKKLTVYLFQADRGSASSCTGACASVWPPVTGKPQAAGAAVAALVGTVTRPDGTTQVTYKGHPLYFYVKDVQDGDAGDTYGQAVKSFGADWYVLAPSGKKVDTS